MSVSYKVFCREYLLTGLLAVRDDIKGRETTTLIRNETHNNRVDYFCVELSSLKSVRNFVEEYKKRTNYKKIDIVIANAGVMVTF